MLHALLAEVQHADVLAGGGIEAFQERGVFCFGEVAYTENACPGEDGLARFARTPDDRRAFLPGVRLPELQRAVPHEGAGE